MSVVDTSGGVLGGSLHVVGRDWNHDLSFIATGLPVPVEPRTSEYYRDTSAGNLTLCYANQVSVGPALYSGDLRATASTTVAYIPPLFTGFPGDLVVGGWDATVTTGSCPTRAAPARPPLARS